MRDDPTPTYAALMQVIRLGMFGDFDLFEFEGLDMTYQLSELANDTGDAFQAWEPVNPDPGPDYVSWHFLVGLFLWSWPHAHTYTHIYMVHKVSL